MSMSMLSGGVSLHRDEEKVDSFVFIPANDDGSIKSRVDVDELIRELAGRGLELIEDEEIPWELDERPGSGLSWQAWVVSFDGSEIAEEVAA